MPANEQGNEGYYAQHTRALAELFGREVTARRDELIVGEARYPVVDDVIVLLEPAAWPASLRRRLGHSTPGGPGGLDGAEDIQATFGMEWQTYADVLADHRAVFAKYFDLIDVATLRGKRVLDLGCGMGRWSFFLKDACRELVLIDFSEAIFVARRNLAAARNALFFMADIRRLPFREKCADLVFSLGVLHHLPTDALVEVRKIGRLAPEVLVYLYYALDNRPPYFRLLLGVVTRLRRLLARVESPTVRTAVTWAIAATVYVPMIGIGRLSKPFGLGRYVPLYEAYHGRSWTGICQDVYDRFFTRIEQRFRRDEILKLTDTFRTVVVSEHIPYWHFLCRE